MNIAIDLVGMLGKDSKNRGIGNYNTEQLKEMFKQDKNNKYFLFNISEQIDLKKIFSFGDNVSEDYYYMGYKSIITSNEKFKDIFSSIIKQFIRKNEIDVFYITSPFDNDILYEKEWFENTKTVATVYDIIPYIFKERYLSSEDVLEKYMQQVQFLKSVDKLLVISQSVKDDLIKYLDFDESKIDVIYSGVADKYFRNDFSQKDISDVLKKYSINRPFIMCTGGDDERKNLAGLITAYSKLSQELKNEYQLVIVCKLSQDSFERYTELKKSLNIEENVILTNFVSEEILLTLYHSAAFFAFVSQYEGFGLPVVEAMAADLPVVTSNNSSLGEIAKDAAILVDPFSPESVISGLEEILSLNSEQKNELTTKAKERLSLFTWKKTAQSTIDGLISTHSPQKKLEPTKSRVKIAMFTPLPPMKSGISDYSVDIINELSKYMDIDVYIDSDYSSNINFPTNVNIYEHTQFKQNRLNYDEIIYQMGNSVFHNYMIDYIKNYKGIMVLHDGNLHGLTIYTQMYLYKKNEDYKNILRMEYPEYKVHEIYQKVLNHDPLVSSEYNVNHFATGNVSDFIVHSRYLKELLLKSHVSANVNIIPLYTKISSGNLKKEKHDAKVKIGVSKSDFIIAAFGHVQNTKRPLQILKAFNEQFNGKEKYKLYFVGEATNEIKEQMGKFILENSIENQVVITGFTSLEDFNIYMSACDLALNLRYPYNGESSASLANLLGKGKCSIITDIGSFSEYPSDIGVKLPPPTKMNDEEEINNISKALKNLIASEEKIVEYEKNAFEYANKHLSLSAVALQYKKVICGEKISAVISELMIKELSNWEFSNNNFDDENLHKLSKTLSIAKYTLFNESEVSI